LAESAGVRLPSFFAEPRFGFRFFSMSDSPAATAESGRSQITARGSPGGPVLAVVDSLTDSLFQNIPTNITAHSVSVDPISGEVFVPYGASTPTFTNTVCPNGCIAVFQDVSTAVPEPSTWAMMLLGFAGLGFAFRQSRRKEAIA
jgi:hypothetical protein